LGAPCLPGVGNVGLRLVRSFPLGEEIDCAASSVDMVRPHFSQSAREMGHPSFLLLIISGVSAADVGHQPGTYVEYVQKLGHEAHGTHS